MSSGILTAHHNVRFGKATQRISISYTEANTGITTVGDTFSLADSQLYTIHAILQAGGQGETKSFLIDLFDETTNTVIRSFNGQANAFIGGSDVSFVFSLTSTAGHKYSLRITAQGSGINDNMLTLANCRTIIQGFGTGAGSPISGSGTVNTLAKFTAPTTLGNSSISDDGVTVAITEPLSIINAPLIMSDGQSSGRLRFNAATQKFEVYESVEGVEAGGAWTTMTPTGGGIGGSGATGQVAFFIGAQSLASTPDFVWDDANNVLALTGLLADTAKIGELQLATLAVQSQSTFGSITCNSGHITTCVDNTGSIGLRKAASNIRLWLSSAVLWSSSPDGFAGTVELGIARSAPGVFNFFTGTNTNADTFLRHGNASPSQYQAAPQAAGHNYYIQAQKGGVDAAGIGGLNGGSIIIQAGDGSSARGTNQAGGNGGSFTVNVGAPGASSGTGALGHGGSFVVGRTDSQKLLELTTTALNVSVVFNSSFGPPVVSRVIMPAPTSNVYHVSGTTSITDFMGAANPGTFVTWIFDEVLTVVSGNRLKLNGNITTAVSSVLTMVWDGSFWYREHPNG
jgi:hypothetical protein